MKKDSHIHIRVSKEYKAKLDKLASQQDMSVSGLVVSALNGRYPQLHYTKRPL